MAERDMTLELLASVRDARAAGQPLAICGSGSKSFLARVDAQGVEPTNLRLLSVAEHAGIIDYRPDELVLTARAGTPLKTIQQLLDQHDQMLAFEPPQFRGGGTLGGAVAAGLAGPGRPWWGSVRDAVLGVELINGAAERVSFGGQVMKNVAGYDVARLTTGAFGTLGVLLSVSVRLRPQPQTMLTVQWEVDADGALERQRAWRLQPVPVSATCYLDGVLSARLAGAESAVLSAAARLGGEPSRDAGLWQRLRDHEHEFFRAGAPLCRAAVAPANPIADDGPVLMEWGGGLRWSMRTQAREPNGSTCFDDRYAAARFMQLPAPMLHYQRRLKAAFDPLGLFNPHLLEAYAD